jgi:hypothetical protein
VTALAPAVESFFTDYLIAQRGASPHAIGSYRDTLRLLFAWIREQSGTRPSDLDFTDVDAATVSGFLAMLEDERHNTSRTRSQRLAAIHSLFRHAALGHPEHGALIARVLAIQPRKPSRKTVAWLAENEADALAYVVIVPCSQMVTVAKGTTVRAEEALSGAVFERRSCGNGEKGPRYADRALIGPAGPREFLLARRLNGREKNQYTFYLCWVPDGRPATMTYFVTIAGRHWPVSLSA